MKPMRFEKFREKGVVSAIFESQVIVAVVLLVMLPLVTPPVMADITNVDAKQLTTDPHSETYPSWSPDGTKMAYYSIDSEESDIISLWVMNADGTGKLRIDTLNSGCFVYMQLSNTGLHFDWSPDSKSIAYTQCVREEFGSDVRSIWVMDIETSEKIELASRAMYPLWSPDGTKIAYTGYLSDRFDGCDLWIMNSDGTGKKKLASNAEFNAFPSWSPDGTKIAYMCMSENQLESAKIWVIDSDRANNAQLASDAKFPKWSPDGAKIAYQSGSSDGDFIWIMNPDGTDKKCLTTNPNSIDFSKSEWSPDSTKIAYNAGVRVEGIWVVNVDGSGEYSITSYAQFISCNPDAWSPDGKRIVYCGPGQKSRSGSVSIYVVNADGTQEKELTSGGYIPSWSPDGGKIAYMSAVSGQTNTDIWVMAINEEEASPTTSTPISTEATIAPTYEIGTYWVSEENVDVGSYRSEWYTERGTPLTFFVYVSNITKIDQVPCYELTFWTQSIEYGGFEKMGKIYASTENIEIIDGAPKDPAQKVEHEMKLLDFPLYVGKSWTSEWHLGEFPDQPLNTVTVTCKVIGIEQFEYYGTNDAYKIQAFYTDFTSMYHYVPQSGDFPGSSILDIAMEEGGGERGHLFKLVKYGKTTAPPTDVNKNNIPDALEDIPKPLDEEESSPSEKKGIPGFEVVSTIAGLLVVTYLLRRNEW